MSQIKVGDAVRTPEDEVAEVRCIDDYPRVDVLIAGDDFSENYMAQELTRLVPDEPEVGPVPLAEPRPMKARFRTMGKLKPEPIDEPQPSAQVTREELEASAHLAALEEEVLTVIRKAFDAGRRLRAQEEGE